MTIGEVDSRQYSNPETYFDEGLFVPKRLADNVLRRVPRVLTLDDNEKMLMYDSSNGLYHQAENALKAEIAKALDEKRNTYCIRETIDAIKTLTYIKRSVVDSNPNLIHLKNGVYNLETGILHPFTPEVISTVRIPVDYDKNASCPQIMKFLGEVAKAEDLNLIQEWFGYLLHKGYPIHAILMLLGEGSNGKTTLLALMIAFVGKDNVSSIPIQEFGRNRFAKAQLCGKLANICADLSDKAVDDWGTAKMLSGGDSVNAEEKFKKPFSFVNHAKMTFSCNELPEIHDNSKGTYRRIKLIEFLNKFEGKDKDIRLLEKLTTPEELSGLFNWAVEGLRRLLENGDFSYNRSTEETRDYYTRKSSPVKAFIMDCLEYDSEGEVSKDLVYQMYLSYCQKHNMTKIEKCVFSSRLKKMAEVELGEGKLGTDGHRVRVWRGIRLKQVDECTEDIHDVQGVHPNPILNIT